MEWVPRFSHNSITELALRPRLPLMPKPTFFPRHPTVECGRKRSPACAFLLLRFKVGSRGGCGWCDRGWADRSWVAAGRAKTTRQPLSPGAASRSMMTPGRSLPSLRLNFQQKQGANPTLQVVGRIKCLAGGQGAQLSSRKITPRARTTVILIIIQKCLLRGTQASL